MTFAYDENNKPVYLDTVVISTQHDPDVTQEWLEEQLCTHVLQPVIADAELEDFVTDELTLLVNPSGSFTLGGPMGDAGLTGRKIIVDTYGGMARHGGGAFSGKDPSKVDRSAAYAMRGPSTPKPPPTGISGAPTWTSHGSTPTACRNYEQRLACNM